MTKGQERAYAAIALVFQTLCVYGVFLGISSGSLERLTYGVPWELSRLARADDEVRAVAYPLIILFILFDIYQVCRDRRPLDRETVLPSESPFGFVRFRTRRYTLALIAVLWAFAIVRLGASPATPVLYFVFGVSLLWARRPRGERGTIWGMMNVARLDKRDTKRRERLFDEE